VPAPSCALNTIPIAMNAIPNRSPWSAIVCAPPGERRPGRHERRSEQHSPAGEARCPDCDDRSVCSGLSWADGDGANRNAPSATTRLEPFPASILDPEVPAGGKGTVGLGVGVSWAS